MQDLSKVIYEYERDLKSIDSQIERLQMDRRILVEALEKLKQKRATVTV